MTKERDKDKKTIPCPKCKGHTNTQSSCPACSGKGYLALSKITRQKKTDLLSNYAAFLWNTPEEYRS